MKKGFVLNEKVTEKDLRRLGYELVGPRERRFVKVFDLGGKRSTIVFTFILHYTRKFYIESSIEAEDGYRFFEGEQAIFEGRDYNDALVELYKLIKDDIIVMKDVSETF